jgi:hypothetical protein
MGRENERERGRVAEEGMRWGVRMRGRGGRPAYLCCWR